MGARERDHESSQHDVYVVRTSPQKAQPKANEGVFIAPVTFTDATYDMYCRQLTSSSTYSTAWRFKGMKRRRRVWRRVQLFSSSDDPAAPQLFSLDRVGIFFISFLLILSAIFALQLFFSPSQTLLFLPLSNFPISSEVPFQAPRQLYQQQQQQLTTLKLSQL